MSFTWSSIVLGVGIYLLILFIISIAAWLFVRFQTERSTEGFYLRTWRWIGKWHVIVLCLTVAGGVAGLLLFPVAGMLIGMDLSIREMAINGLLDGSFYLLIWAPGISFITCLMLANRKERQPAADVGKTLDSKD